MANSRGELAHPAGANAMIPDAVVDPLTDGTAAALRLNGVQKPSTRRTDAAPL